MVTYYEKTDDRKQVAKWKDKLDQSLHYEKQISGENAGNINPSPREEGYKNEEKKGK